MYSNSLTVFFIRILFVICFSFSLLQGEAHPDTSTSIKSPKKAASSALVFPGGGQLYNGKIIKAGLILAGEVIAIINWHKNSQLYSSYDANNDAEYPLPKHRYLEKRNKSVWWIGFIYIYGLIDAIVDAHLHPFEDVMAEELGNNQNPVEKKKEE
jgi:hypothetical protein|tara:strand:- start:254 stop:718 length:465 start_codon:yes stop_codon:yes gene_type:complete